MSSNKILAKQLNYLFKNELPNIKVSLQDDNNMTKLNVTFYYKRSFSDDVYPYFFPKNYDDSILIQGTVDLTDFPNKPPKFTLLGEVAHCHVHGNVICFSLDESYQWFFGQKHMQSSKFNPSVSISYYLFAVYKFLAEDDREHEVSNDRRQKMLDFWSKKNKDIKDLDLPTVMVPYYECLQLAKVHGNVPSNDKVIDKKSIMDKFGFTDLLHLPDTILALTDFVDKEPLLLQEEPNLYCINYTKVGERHVFKVVSLDLMKYSTFTSGIRKTSTSQEFNNAFPIVIHSNIFSKSQVQIQKILDDLVKTAFSQVKANQVIRLDDKVNIYDHYLYIISELFNELAIDVFSEAMFPCEEVIKGFVYLHHLLLVLDNKAKIGLRAEQILDFFEKDIRNRDKKMCGNLGILMTQYLTSNKKRDIGLLIDEMLARNVMWSLKKPNECKSCVGYNPTTKSFYITDMSKWINVTWQNSYVGMQRFAFQQLYNNKFSKETLETMDNRFGQVAQDEIEIFQKSVKDLCNWKNLKGEEGYKTFLEYYGLTDDNLADRLKNAMTQSTKAGYHSFLFSKEWKSGLNGITNAKVVN